jgi:hypothetical protein
MESINWKINKDKLDPHNAMVYLDIARDIFQKKEGVFTFIIRIDGKKIVDYVQMETITYE